LPGVPGLKHGARFLFARGEHERIAGLEDEHRLRIGFQHLVEELRLVARQGQ
jgi:hypothetical protein